MEWKNGSNLLVNGQRDIRGLRVFGSFGKVLLTMKKLPPNPIFEPILGCENGSNHDRCFSSFEFKWSKKYVMWVRSSFCSNLRKCSSKGKN
jgi:hypothetical protein